MRSSVPSLGPVGIVRGSGLLDLMVAALSPGTTRVGVPAELLPVILLRPLSGSGALGLTAEILKTHGPDSPLGLMASTIQGSTETTFYVLAVYCGAVGVKRTRHALAVARVLPYDGSIPAPSSSRTSSATGAAAGWSAA